MTSRRSFLARLGSASAAAAFVDPSALYALVRAVDRPRPTPSQLAWQRDELALFLHFGVNTFSDREWGDGKESPASFNPTKLDARQWARAAKAAGARSMILTAKHHDGFCLWPTKTTTHSVASSPFRDGKGDVVREFVDACRAEGMRPGLYCSPWDRNHAAYGDSPRYNDIYAAQLTELLTQYGELAEVWFDGANGEGPNGKKQVYDWPRNWALVRKLQPNAVMFSDAGPDVRWIGNERGVAGETNWSTIRPESVPYIGADGPGIIKALQEGHADGQVWRPGETDVSIRPGWFYHAAEDSKVKTADQLVGLYFTSVGRNSKLLLNVPPTRDGLLHDVDVANLAEMRKKLDAMHASERRAGRTEWRVERDTAARLTVRFNAPQSISVVELSENIANGQRVSTWSLYADGARTPVLTGTTIGYKQLRRVEGITATELELRVEAIDKVERVGLKVFA